MEVLPKTKSRNSLDHPLHCMIMYSHTNNMNISNGVLNTLALGKTRPSTTYYYAIFTSWWPKKNSSSTLSSTHTQILKNCFEFVMEVFITLIWNKDREQSIQWHSKSVWSLQQRFLDCLDILFGPSLEPGYSVGQATSSHNNAEQMDKYYYYSIQSKIS